VRLRPGERHDLRAGLDDPYHGASTDRAGAPKSRPSVSKDDRLRICRCPPVPALHAQMLIFTTSRGRKKGTGAQVGALLLGAAAGPKRCRDNLTLTGLIVIKDDALSSKPLSQCGLPLAPFFHLFQEELGLAPEPIQLSLGRFLDLSRAWPLPALVGEIVTASAEKLGFFGRKIEFAARLETSRANELHPLCPKGGERAHKGDGRVTDTREVLGLKQADVQLFLPGSHVHLGDPVLSLREGDPGVPARMKHTLSAESKDIQDKTLFHRFLGHRCPSPSRYAHIIKQRVAFLHLIYAGNSAGVNLAPAAQTLANPHLLGVTRLISAWHDSPTPSSDASKSSGSMRRPARTSSELVLLCAVPDCMAMMNTESTRAENLKGPWCRSVTRLGPVCADF